MVDVWTQWVLSPLHDYVFKILRTIGPTDGTFDQDNAVRYIQRLLSAPDFRCAFSYDLSAATDRLPLRLQVLILNELSPELGDQWSNLLVNRDYYTPDDVPLRYAAGQPMGALSS